HADTVLGHDHRNLAAGACRVRADEGSVCVAPPLSSATPPTHPRRALRRGALLRTRLPKQSMDPSMEGHTDTVLGHDHRNLAAGACRVSVLLVSSSVTPPLSSATPPTHPRRALRRGALLRTRLPKQSMDPSMEGHTDTALRHDHRNLAAGSCRLRVLLVHVICGDEHESAVGCAARRVCTGVDLGLERPAHALLPSIQRNGGHVSG